MIAVCRRPRSPEKTIVLPAARTMMIADPRMWPASAHGAVGELGLQFRRVEEHETAELHGAGRRVDQSVEPACDEMWDESAVIQVRVREEQRIDLARVVGEWEAVAHGLVRTSLEHPAIDQYASVARVEEVLRAGDGRRAPQKGKLHARLFWPLRCSGRCSEATRSPFAPRVRTMRSISCAGSPTWRSRGTWRDAWRSRSSRSRSS